MISRAIDFLRTDLWRIRSRSLPWHKAVPLKILRIAVISFKAVTKDELHLRASSLTFFSLLSVVPLLAMFFGLAKGFGLEKALEQELLERLRGQEEVLTFMIGFAHNFLEKTKGGVIASIGVVVLFWSIIKALGDIENAFNLIWGVKKGRSIYRKISDYLSVCLVGPFLFLTASAVTVLIAAETRTLTGKVAILGSFSPGIALFLRILPICAIWILFSFIYVFMPNTKVRFRCGILAGVLAGTSFQIFQSLYIKLQIGVAKYNAIYGGFAALPFFVVWLQLSWFIVLVGAQISHAYQNVDAYELEPDARTISPWLKRVATLLLVRLLVKGFCSGRSAVTREEIVRELDLPIPLVAEIVQDLLDARLISEVRTGDARAGAYQIAADPDRMTIQFVLDTLDHCGSETIAIAETEGADRIESSLKAFDELIGSSPNNLLLKNL